MNNRDCCVHLHARKPQPEGLLSLSQPAGVVQAPAVVTGQHSKVAAAARVPGRLGNSSSSSSFSRRLSSSSYGSNISSYGKFTSRRVRLRLPQWKLLFAMHMTRQSLRLLAVECKQTLGRKAATAIVWGRPGNRKPRKAVDDDLRLCPLHLSNNHNIQRASSQTIAF